MIYGNELIFKRTKLYVYSIFLGGVGIFTRGCQSQWNAPWTGWGQQYGGVRSDAECNQLPRQLQSGCHFRFKWFKNADNPKANFRQVACPKQLTSITGCSA